MDKKVLVVYSSKRGSTRQYAEWIAEDLGEICTCDLTDFAGINEYNLQEYDFIVYGGWIRGSGIVDFDNFRKIIKRDMSLLDRMIVFGVGVANETPENYMQVWSLNLGKIDPRNVHRATLYILAGAYDPEKITGMDNMLMKVMKKVLIAGSTKEASREAQLMKERLENGVDMVERGNIRALVKEVKSKLGA